MCRYSFAPYKTHFACLADRRVAKHPVDAAPRCQDCGELMVVLGRDFHAPRRDNRRERRKLAKMAEVGVRAFDLRWREDSPLFDSCGCGGPGARPRTLADAKIHLGHRRSSRRAPAVKPYERIPRSRAWR